MQETAHKLPSRIKYEKSHPTISVRVSRELYDGLKNLMKITGKSMGDVLREALDKQMPSAKKAYQSGYDAGKDLFAVSYHCYLCGEQMTVWSKEQKEAAAQYMKSHGWSHTECIRKRENTPSRKVLVPYTINKPLGGGPPITKFVEVDQETWFIIDTP
jgi:hypothetical protein